MQVLSDVGNLVGARDLIWSWTIRTVRARYQQSLLGWLWAVAQPAASVVILTIVFTKFVPLDTGDIPYPVFLYVAMVPWTFLGASLTDMANSLVQNRNLVTKAYFAREVLPIAAMLSRSLDFSVASGLVGILLWYYRVPVSLTGMLLLPVILATQSALIVGLGLIVAALNVFTRDVEPLLKLVVQLWFYGCPVIYPISMVPDGLLPFYLLNPMVGVLEAYRDVVLRQSLPGPYLAISGAVALVVLVVGYWFFKRVEHLFADIV